MITCTIAFYGAENDSYGMPIPYHSYFIIASEWLIKNSGIATITPLTDAPLPSQMHFPVTTGGPESAIKKAIEALKSIDGNNKLKRREDYPA